MKKPKKTVSVRAFSVVMLILAAIITIFSMLQEHKVNDSIANQTEALVERREETEFVHTFTAASDFLTEQVKYFVTTGKTEYLYRYWDEVDETKRREQSTDALKERSLSEEELDLSQNGLNLSNALSEKEAWLMRLIADSVGLPETEMPKQVAAVKYEHGEEALTGPEKQRIAVSYLFGKEYEMKKQEIYDNMAQLQELMLERKQKELAEAVHETQSAQELLTLMNRALLLVIICFVAVFFRLILRPFNQYAGVIGRLEQDKQAKLKPAGGRETVEFARIFNRIHSEFLKNQQQLENERFRFRMAIENTQIIIFEYDFKSDTYYGYGNIEALGDGESQEAERVIPEFFQKHLEGMIEPPFLETAQSFFKTTTFINRELRVRQEVEWPHFLWARITVNPVLDENGQQVRLFGKITNIEKEKEKELALEDLKMRDSMTGLYTREAGIRLVKEYMEQKPAEEVCGMFLLDMDNFEEVNREEGSAFADAILQETAGILRSMTGEEDYHIRLGGDEFMVFVKHCSRLRATTLGPAIVEQIKNLSGGGGVTISVSMGMCVTEVTNEYGSLYRCAESSLKYVKENCQGAAVCYQEASRALGRELIDLYPESHKITSISRAANNQGAFIPDALELLESSKSLSDAVYLLLSRVGRMFNLDRVSMVEINQEYLTYRYLYQWTEDSRDRQRKDTYYMPPENMKKLIDLYEDGISTRYVGRTPERMNSILHAAIWNQGVYEGFMSFEVTAENYQWTTEEKRVIRELSKVIASFVLKEKADSTSRAKTEFLSRMSHEIRTPMNAISGMTDIALKKLDDREKVQSCLKKIKMSNVYLLSLINDILDMSRIESGKMELAPEAVVLDDELGELTEMMRPQFEQNKLKFTVVKSFDSGLTVRADFLRLSQVLINLLGNALKFTPPGGEVTLLVEQKECSGERQNIKFAVSDTGTGISEESIERIFNAFEQENKEIAATYGGTGLGLSISSRLIQMMGGQLKVESKVGEGSVFFFTLNFPVEDSGNVSGTNHAEERIEKFRNPAKAGTRVLLVEDNELNREIADTILTMNGFTVEHAENGKLAVETFFSHPAYYYDVILMDIRMPVMDGLEATRQIRLLEKEDSRTVPIIAMTANAFDGDMRKSMDSGMNGHLSKPFDIDKLLKMLEEVLA